jgi:uncharacterized protein YjbJ (UPF0337 family)
MSKKQKIKNESTKAAGSAKEAVSHSNDDSRGAREGQRQRRMASVKQAGENIRDALRP